MISLRLSERKRLYRLFALIVAIPFVLITVFVPGIPGVDSEALSVLRIRHEFSDAMGIVKTNYAGAVDPSDSTQWAIRGMLRTLDPHSNYLDPAEFSDMRREQESQFFGIGVTINRRNGRVYVLSVVPGTPAARVGLRYGDAILAVGKESALNWSTQEVARHVRGERDTPVQVTIDRLGETKPLTFTIRRGPVPLPSIRNAFMIRPGLGYIGLTGGFQTTTTQELTDKIDELEEQGLKGLILDLRNNPGGLLEQAIDVTSLFLKQGEVIVSIRSRKSERPPIRSEGGLSERFPMVVLINRGSASASEIVAGALQDHDRAIVVGEPSFGKGLVQTVYPLMRGAGGAVTLTTARYYTPSGRSLQRNYEGLTAFEYFTGRPQKPNGAASRTDGGRTVYSGGGIEPDILSIPPEDPIQARLFSGIFDFIRKLVSGTYPGFEDYRVERPEVPSSSTAYEFEVGDRLFQACRTFLIEQQDLRLRASEIDGHLSFIRERLQEEWVAARYGVDAGYRAFLLHDPQILKAIDAFSEARQLVENLRHPRQRN
ncbi:MAG: S41 family peptidase [Acidobacteria bacterium]|nr:S41 family peptidase [Acidobacteriota bacterium]